MAADTDGHLTKIQSIHDFKVIQQTKNEGEHPQLDNIYKKTYVNILFNGEINTGHLLPNTENKMRISLSSFRLTLSNKY